MRSKILKIWRGWGKVLLPNISNKGVLQVFYKTPGLED